MARLWIIYREGLHLFGAVVASVPLEPTVTRVDLAPWRLFTRTAPDEVPLDRVNAHRGRRRVLVEVREEDREDLCGLTPGFYDSPYSPDEARRRLGLGDGREPALPAREQVESRSPSG